MKPKNIFYKGNIESYEYYTKKDRFKNKIPDKDWKKHSKKLLEDLDNISKILEKETGYEDGEYLEFTGVENFNLRVQSLKNKPSKIKVIKSERIVNNQNENFYDKALIYLPKNKKEFFKNKIIEYSKSDGKKEKNLINTIEKIKLATIENFWTGDISDIPNENEKWCELWLEKIDIGLIKEKIKKLNIEMRDKFLEFEERNVILCKVNKAKILDIIKNIDGICELKLKSDFSIETFLDKVDREEQYEWIEELKNRTIIPKDNNFNSSVLLIDSGVTNTHPLLKGFLSNENCKGYFNENNNDDIGHGTKMAGLVLYQDLAFALDSLNKITINHELQSYKIIYLKNSQNPDLYGSITDEAVLFSKDLFNQINCMAIASDEKTDRGYPTSWSAKIDELCFGDVNRPEGRIFCLSAGNVNIINKNIDIEDKDLGITNMELDYPDLNEMSTVEDPGQAWNALTIGGYTSKYSNSVTKKIVAEPYSLSPFSKTSYLWNSKGGTKLIKPEVLFEAGNAIKDEFGYSQHEEVSLLTTNSNIDKNYFNNFCATSAATALAANFCAKLVNEYPNAWPQTIRGLVVHSAEWTDQMKNQFLKDNTKTSYGNLLRICGYGVPNIKKALGTLKNSANLVIEAEIKPFKLNEKKDIRYNELHIHKLPWPEDFFLQLADKKFKVKVTLSYFIEPNPGNFRGIYDYQSYGLRFEFSGNRTKEELIKKISKVDGKKYSDVSSDNWTYGSTTRNVGSIHSDIWEGTGAEFAENKHILVYPVGGWWKQKKKAEKYKNKVRYSLIVSISSEEEIDLFTPIYNEVLNTAKNKNLVEIKSNK